MLIKSDDENVYFHLKVVRTRAFDHQHTLIHFEKNLRLGKLRRSFQKKCPISYGETYSWALHQIEMDTKCDYKRQQDMVEIMKS